MKVLANATTLLAAISIMIGLLVAQHGYQNSWHEPTATQAPAADAANADALERGGGYRVVLK